MEVLEFTIDCDSCGASEETNNIDCVGVEDALNWIEKVGGHKCNKCLDINPMMKRVDIDIYKKQMTLIYKAVEIFNEIEDCDTNTTCSFQIKQKDNHF